MADPSDRAGGPPFGRAGARLYDGLGLVGGGVLAAMALAVFVQVVTRFLARTPMDGLDEIPRYLFVWLVMMGAASAMHRGEHTCLEYFRERLSPRGRALASALTDACGILLFLSLIRSSVTLVPNAQLQSSAGLGLPLGYVFAAVPVGAALITLPMAWNLVAALRALWRKPS